MGRGQKVLPPFFQIIINGISETTFIVEFLEVIKFPRSGLKKGLAAKKSGLCA